MESRHGTDWYGWNVSKWQTAASSVSYSGCRRQFAAVFLTYVLVALSGQCFNTRAPFHRGSQRHSQSIRRALVTRGGEQNWKSQATSTVDLGGRAVSIRRLTNEDELNVTLIEELFDPEELDELYSMCEARHGFQASLQREASGETVVDARRTSASCPMLWPLFPATSWRNTAEQAMLLLQMRSRES
eukprot:TRINITY_DN15674_c0_g1_i1.p1 TRINITY_DN15674_c0_g1~~TRINITY_DN15674_c0_g1_i1.p1  ORF type:complete len:187 (+),score=35.40 TRINITY_DN15674_c0_g1_i1:38-598(+)